MKTDTSNSMTTIQVCIFSADPSRRISHIILCSFKMPYLWELPILNIKEAFWKCSCAYVHVSSVVLSVLFWSEGRKLLHSFNASKTSAWWHRGGNSLVGVVLNLIYCISPNLSLLQKQLDSLEYFFQFLVRVTLRCVIINLLGFKRLFDRNGGIDLVFWRESS